MNLKRKNRMESIGKDAYTRTIVDRRHFHGLPDNHLESNGESEIYLCKESKIDKLPLVKDIYIEEKNIIKFNEEDKYFYHIFENDAEPETRYFIMIYGKECTIDDIVSMPYTSIKDMIKSHTKNINMTILKEAVQSQA